MSLGSHHKTRNIKKLSIDEFIESADTIPEESKAVHKKTVENILLTFSGKIDRENMCDKKPVLIYLRKDVSRDLNDYCHGNKQGILNYLIRKGLDELIKNKKFELVLE